MLKDRIIRAATALYARYGIKKVSMDNISEILHISKRTIYREFASKEELLSECFNRELRKINVITEAIREKSGSALEEILVTCRILSDCYTALCPAFYRDVIRYPSIQKNWNRYLESLRARCEENFNRGAREGDFLPDQNYELISMIFIEQVWRLKQPYQMSIIMNILRGQCTPAGIDKLNALIEREQIKNPENIEYQIEDEL